MSGGKAASVFGDMDLRYRLHLNRTNPIGGHSGLLPRYALI